MESGCSTDCFEGKNPCEGDRHRLAFATLLTAAPKAFGVVQSRNLEAKTARSTVSVGW